MGYKCLNEGEMTQKVQQDPLLIGRQRFQMRFRAGREAGFKAMRVGEEIERSWSGGWMGEMCYLLQTTARLSWTFSPFRRPRPLLRLRPDQPGRAASPRRQRQRQCRRDPSRRGRARRRRARRRCRTCGGDGGVLTGVLRACPLFARCLRLGRGRGRGRRRVWVAGLVRLKN